MKKVHLTISVLIINKQMKTRRHKETLGGVGYICYFDCSDSFMVYAYIQSHQISYMNKFNFIYINYTLIQLFKKRDLVDLNYSSHFISLTSSTFPPLY